MDDQRWNPYLVLGVDYLTDADDARRAWIAKVRLVRQGLASTYTVEDLNTALDQIEHPREDPLLSERWFRVPAIRPSRPEPRERGLFSPAPKAMARRTTTPSDDEVTTLARVAARSVCTQLLQAASPTVNVDPYAGAPRDVQATTGAER